MTEKRLALLNAGNGSTQRELRFVAYDDGNRARKGAKHRRAGVRRRKAQRIRREIARRGRR